MGWGPRARVLCEMALPRLADVELALLRALVTLGGQAPSSKVYPQVTKQFPDLTPEQLAEGLPSGGNRWTNRIQWVRLHLVQNGEMASAGHGIWAITEKGRARVQAAASISDAGRTASEVSLVDLYEDYEATFRAKLLDRLMQMTPAEFEQFGRRILRAYGFVKVVVTEVSNDGGVDGHGQLRIGLASMSVAFQCKRWRQNVQRPEVDKFRGAIQGEYEQGIFFATSDFSSGAREASIKKGAVPIILQNGESILTLMLEKGLGVSRTPLYLYEERPDELIGPTEQ
jgi:restriction system protein